MPKMGSIVPGQQRPGRESIMPTNLDQMDFSKPEKYLREIFSFISEHTVFQENTTGTKIQPNNLSFMKKGSFSTMNG